MLFNSYNFIFCFLPIFFIGWNISKNNKTMRLSVLLTASYVFYAYWDYRFTALMAFTTMVNYFAGHLIHRLESHRSRKFVLIASIGLSLFPLFFFKYFPWLGSYFSVFFDGDSRSTYNFFLSSIILPVGISFFTFQAISYTVDLYKGQCTFCKSLLKFATFVSMFPQLVAGPIIRFRNIDAQLENINKLEGQVDYQRGTELFFRGLIKKVIFADQIGILIDPSFALGAPLNTELAWISILGYSLQIYFDFSGYSDMAIGMGRCLGFKFPDNFIAPYTASNPSEFWRRWHVTLSTWLRDYIYIPLGGNRKGRVNTLLYIMITMLLGGLWHGAAWTFILWGFWHGFILIVYRVTPSQIKDVIPGWISVILMNLAILIGWTFFRLPDIGQAFEFLSIMAGMGTQTASVIAWPLYILIPAGYAFHFLERRDFYFPVSRGLVYAVSLTIASTWAVLELGRDAPFIYFQF